MIRSAFILATASLLLVAALVATACPPAVGIIGNSRNCLTCHVSNGSWTDANRLIIDLIDKTTQRSLLQSDGSFLLSAKRGTATTMIAVLGYRASGSDPVPYRNGWTFVDSTTFVSSALSKFAPGWEINVPFGCRITGDKIDAYPDGVQSTAPITIRPTEFAKDGEVTLQTMLTSGESVKGNAKSGLVGNYYERTVHLRVTE